MARKAVRTDTAEVSSEKAKMAEKLWEEIHDLQRQRKEAFDRHEKHRREMSRYMSPLGLESGKGCEEAAEIADKIELLIETGKKLGLIAADVDYMDLI